MNRQLKRNTILIIVYALLIPTGVILSITAWTVPFAHPINTMMFIGGPVLSIFAVGALLYTLFFKLQS